MADRTTWAWAQPEGQRQVVDVAVNQGYRPEAILARADLPLRIRFLREDDDPCTERVVFSAPRVDRRLAMRGVTVIDLPAQPAGEIRFTCGMGRYRGRIQLMDAGVHSRTLGIGVPLRGRLALWLVSLPLVVGAAVALLDGVALAAVAALALIGWLAAYGPLRRGAPDVQ